MRICSVPRCRCKHHTHGFCGKHWHRFRRHGDPQKTSKTSWQVSAAWIEAHVNFKKSNCLPYPYGQSMRYDERFESVYRIMCRLKHGAPPSSKHEVCHSCGKGHEKCINPNHLRWDTRKANLADKIEHGTHNRGEQCPTHKLTETDVKKIRRLKGRMTATALGQLFGVRQVTISDIHNKRTWAWLD